MTLKTVISKALNTQINNEFTASYHYLGMAVYFESQSLPGFAGWFRAQSVEETGHGMKIHDYIHRRDGEVKLTDVPALSKSFQSAEDVVQTALAMEQTVTDQVNDIHALAVKESDAATQDLMTWFVNEQVEEEESMRDLLEKVRAAGNDRWRVLMLDGELAARSAE
ncbi:MAG: ferritin [Paracoccaceae bacterium]